MAKVIFLNCISIVLVLLCLQSKLVMGGWSPAEAYRRAFTKTTERPLDSKELCMLEVRKMPSAADALARYSWCLLHLTCDFERDGYLNNDKSVKWDSVEHMARGNKEIPDCFQSCAGSSAEGTLRDVYLAVATCAIDRSPPKSGECGRSK